ncbi:MAG: helix-turn-helix domain-containing protein [Terrimicrobiaceae bacterium]
MQEKRSNSRYYWECRNRGDNAFVILQWTRHGAGFFELEGRRQPVPESTAFLALVPESSAYGYPAGGRSPWVFSWLNVYGDFGVSLWRGFREKFGAVLPLAPASQAGLVLQHLLQRVATRADTDRFQIGELAYSFYLKWWAQLEQPRSGDGSSLDHAIRYCREHFLEPVTIKELADRAHLSREHFTREFQARLGISPGRFLRRERLGAARSLLKSSPLPLDEVARRSGFYSARQLRDAHQKAFGRPPPR